MTSCARATSIYCVTTNWYVIRDCCFHGNCELCQHLPQGESERVVVARGLSEYKAKELARPLWRTHRAWPVHAHPDSYLAGP